MKKKIIETTSQVKIKLYEEYLNQHNIWYKKKILVGNFRIYIKKKDIPLINEREILGTLYGSVEKNYFGISEYPPINCREE